MQGQTYKNYYFKINKKILQKLNTKQNIKKIVNSQKACKTRYLDHETGTRLCLLNLFIKINKR